MLNKKLFLLFLINNGLEAFRSSNPDYSRNNNTDNYHVIDRSYKQKPTVIIDRSSPEIVVLETPKIYYEPFYDVITPIRPVVSRPVIVDESSFGTFLLAFIGLIGAIFIIGIIINPSKKNIIIKDDDESDSSIIIKTSDPIDSALNGKNPNILDHKRDSYLNHIGYNNNDPYYLLNTANLNEQKFEKLIRGIIDDSFDCEDPSKINDFAENILLKFQKNTLDLLNSNYIQNLLVKLNKRLSINFEFKENSFNQYKSGDFYQVNNLISKLISRDPHILILYDSNNLERLLQTEILNKQGIYGNKIYLKKI